MSKLYIPIAGTFAFADDTVDKDPQNRRWWQYDSNFDHLLSSYEYESLDPHDPFIWTTNLNGIEFWRRWGFLQSFFKDKDKDHRDWISAGAALSYWFAAKHVTDVESIVIAHSHAYQVIAYACAYHNVKIDRLITVASPIRTDMDPIYKIARGNIRKHLHIYDGGKFSDWTQWLGERGSGSFTTIRECKYADYNDPVGKINHSKILSNPDDFHYWADRKWIKFMDCGEFVTPLDVRLIK